MILITGGLGYLGSRLVGSLFNSQKKIRIASSRDKASISELKLNNQEDSLPNIVKIDLSNKQSLLDACNGIDAIVHLAAMDAQASSNEPVSALKVNGLGTFNLLQAAIEEGVKKIVYLSTVHVYQSPLEGFIDEETLPQPSHHYAISHKIAEDYILQAHRLNQITGVIFRLSNAVGSPSSEEGSAWKLAINDLCKQVVQTKRMVFSSNPEVQRDFVPMSDVCNAIEYSLFKKEFDGEIVNLSSGISLSLKDLSQLISDRTKTTLGFTPEIIFEHSETAYKPQKKLEIPNKKMTSGNFKLNNSLSSEIDRILTNSSEWF